MNGSSSARSARGAARTGLELAVVVMIVAALVLALASVSVGVRFRNGHAVGTLLGSIVWGQGYGGESPTWYFTHRPSVFFGWWPRRFVPGNGATALVIPAWCASAVAVIGWFLVRLVCWTWRRRARSRGDSRCVHCAYNLTGNVSGRCPECGTPIGTPRRRHVRRAET